MPPFLIVLLIRTQYLPAKDIKVVKGAPLLPLSSFVTCTNKIWPFFITS